MCLDGLIKTRVLFKYWSLAHHMRGNPNFMPFRILVQEDYNHDILLCIQNPNHVGFIIIHLSRRPFNSHHSFNSLIICIALYTKSHFLFKMTFSQLLTFWSIVDFLVNLLTKVNKPNFDCLYNTMLKHLIFMSLRTFCWLTLIVITFPFAIQFEIRKLNAL